VKLFIHLNFPGNCEQAFRYYEENLGGKILSLMKQSEAPGQATTPKKQTPFCMLAWSLPELF
jgi:PhnB protein